MSVPLQVGIIGCGSVSEKYIPHLQRLNMPKPRAEIAVVCDVMESRRDEVRERYGLTNFTTDYQQVIGNPDIDLVLVLTSMPLHGKITKEALEAGKHVLVEKPMSMSLEEAAEIVQLAKSSPGYLVCAPHVILSPTYQAMWQHLRRGDIGQVLTARGFYGWSGPTWGPWYYQMGGGSMFDLGVYNVTTLTGLLGPAKRITALSGVAIPNRIVDGEPFAVVSHDNAHLLLDFGDSRFAVVTTGFTIQQYNVAGIELYGSEGTLQMIGDDWAPRGYELWQNNAGCWKVYADTGGYSWTEGIRHMIESIESGIPPKITPEHAYHVLEIMVKTMESGNTGRALEIESTFTPPEFPDAPILGADAHLAHDPGRE
jgi:predicted dehydrogenase